jgi:hypothetical protein
MVKFTVFYTGDFVVQLIPEIIRIYADLPKDRFYPTVFRSDGNFLFQSRRASLYIDIPNSDDYVKIHLSDNYEERDIKQEDEYLKDGYLYALDMRLDFEIDDNIILIRPSIVELEDGFIHDKMDDIVLIGNQDKPLKSTHIIHPYFENYSIKIEAIKGKKDKLIYLYGMQIKT